MVASELELFKKNIPTMGSDPEVFVVRGKRETVFPAWEFLPSKEDGGEVGPFWDGFQGEWNTQPTPATKSPLEGIKLGLQRILGAAKAKDPTARLSLKSVVNIPKMVMRKAPEFGVRLGCSPSKNAYGLRGKPVENPYELGVRFAGMHLHIGCSELDVNFEHLTKMLDGVLGVAGVTLAQGLDDPVRRQFYGLAGEYRLPKHGLEYRVLSNFPLAHPAIADLVFELAYMAVCWNRMGVNLSMLGPEGVVQEIINNSDVALARGWIEKNWKFYETYFQARYGNGYWEPNPWKTNKTRKALLEGIGAVVETPGDLEENWRVFHTWKTFGVGI